LEQSPDADEQDFNLAPGDQIKTKAEVGYSALVFETRARLAR